MFALKIQTMQKYRLYLTRLQKEKENSGMKHSDASPKDPPGSFGSIHQSDVVNSSYRFSGNSLLPRTVDSSSHEDDLKSIISEPVMEPKVNHPDSHKTKNSQMGFNRSFQPLESEVDFAAFNSGIPTKSYWGEAPDVHFRQEHKPFIHLETGFTKLPLPDPLNHVNADSLQSIPSTAEGGISGPAKSTPPRPEYGSNQISDPGPKESILDQFPQSSKSNIVNHPQALEPIYPCTSSFTTQASYFSCTADIESAQRDVPNLASGPSSTLAFFEDDLQALLQGDYFGEPLGVRNLGFLDYIGAGLINEVPIHLHDSPRFGYEYPCDLTEYAILDQAY